MQKFAFLPTLVVALASALLTSGCKHSTDPTYGMIRGTVTVQSTGAPLAGARVAVKGRQATTGADGAFQFDKIETGVVNVLFQADRYVSTQGQVTVVQNQAATLNAGLMPESCFPGSMTAKVDGKSWAAGIQPAQTGCDTVAVAAWSEIADGVGFLTVVGVHAEGYPNPIAGTVNVILAISPLQKGSIALGGVEGVGAAAYADVLVEDAGWVTDDTHVGTLVIDAVDEAGGRLKGHFEYEGVNENGTTRTISSGQFDVGLILEATPALAIARIESRMRSEKLRVPQAGAAMRKFVASRGR